MSIEPEFREVHKWIEGISAFVLKSGSGTLFHAARGFVDKEPTRLALAWRSPLGFPATPQGRRLYQMQHEIVN